MFTGRFHKPGVAVEVLFDKICRENGITHRLTKIHSPSTGKIERVHQILQRELLDVHGPFESIEALQAALDAWRQEYNTSRPHQSLAMGFPAGRFTPASSPLELRIPAQLTASSRTLGGHGGSGVSAARSATGRGAGASPAMCQVVSLMVLARRIVLAPACGNVRRPLTVRGYPAAIRGPGGSRFCPCGAALRVRAGRLPDSAADGACHAAGFRGVSRGCR